MPPLQILTYPYNNFLYSDWVKWFVIIILFVSLIMLGYFMSREQKLYGVNMSGAEFGEKALPGEIDKDYHYPRSDREYQYFQDKKVRLLRFPIRWERVQQGQYEDLSHTDISQIQQVLDGAHRHGMKVILDLHNFGRYYDRPLTLNDADALADVWVKLAKEFKNHPGLYGYELMNEPHDLPAGRQGLPGGSDTWVELAQHVTSAIRHVDTEHVILIPGYNWQNVQEWTKNNPHLIIHDPSNNLIYTSHMYFDSSRRGTYTIPFANDHANVNIGVSGSEDFRRWLEKHHARGMFTEFGVPPQQEWLDTMDHFLAAVDKDPNIVGAIYWSAGPWWGDYPLSIEPKNGVDKPQMKVLEKYTR